MWEARQCDVGSSPGHTGMMWHGVGCTAGPAGAAVPSHLTLTHDSSQAHPHTTLFLPLHPSQAAPACTVCRSCARHASSAAAPCSTHYGTCHSTTVAHLYRVLQLRHVRFVALADHADGQHAERHAHHAASRQGRFTNQHIASLIIRAPQQSGVCGRSGMLLRARAAGRNGWMATTTCSAQSVPRRGEMQGGHAAGCLRQAVAPPSIPRLLMSG